MGKRGVRSRKDAPRRLRLSTWNENISGMERGSGPDLTLRERREHTVARLCEHFAQDDLTLEELERRIDVAQRATDPADLEQLLRDLQPKVPAVPQQQAMPARVSPAAPVQRKEQGMLIALMGGVERRGAWRPAADTFVLALMGGADLDFREVQLPPGVTEINVLAVMGGVDIVVPPDLAVEAAGIAIMGGFAHRNPPATPHPDAPLLKINGFALMGGVDISVRRPGESAKDARQRERRERRGK